MNSSFVEPTSASTGDLKPVPVVLIDPQGADPIRGELLGLERLASHGRLLAPVCELAPRRRASSPLLTQFERNSEVLNQVHKVLTAAGGPHGIDAEWLIDNFHIIEDSLREVRRDLPPGYDVLLPKLSVPPLEGYPRVYALALALVAHGDSELDERRIAAFVQAFQETAPLLIGELWALPTMLRLVLLENLRRLSDKMIWRWEETCRAERWAKTVIDGDDQAPQDGPPANVSAALPERNSLTDPFVVRLIQLLRDQGRGVKALENLEDVLRERGSDPNEVLRREQVRQAANQVTVGNCVLSLRLLSAVDWNSFFEQTSHVEAVLRDDPAGIYPRQDFATSDRYRRAVELIARGSNADEIEVARRAVEMARRDHGGSSEPLDHVGIYLIDRGQNELKAAFGYRPLWRERLLDWVRGHANTVYFGSITLGLVVATVLVIVLALGGLPASWWVLVLAALVLLPLSELAVGVVNQVLTLFLPPRVLPKLDVKNGIGPEHATFVVIPSLLVRPASAATLLERLELHYLANPDPNLRFALLTDFTDAPAETMPQDEGLIDDALDRVHALNERYASDGAEIFFIFHRHRLWNEAQGCWMGWERKRGKLLEFNRLLRGARDTSYSVLSADLASLPRIQFVITLDADTQMPRDTAGRLVGSLAHPLNRPRFDPALERVVTGFGVLQPRISFHLTAATHSRFAALLATSGGIDPYSTAASDAYMDLFGEGSFTGKGIYEVDAFEAATGSTFPENQVLSHDLIEGNYARCGLLSDTELFDDFPARYRAYARREHRWVRGDWQLLPWLGRRVPTAKGWRANSLPLLERWKLFDNLRRSLVPPALVVLLILGWTILPGSPWLWTAVALATLGVPFFQSLLGTVVDSIRGGSLSILFYWAIGVRALLGQIVLEIAFVAYRGQLLLDAIGRTLVRLLWTRRKLLEWETAASTDRRLQGGLLDTFTDMWAGPALAIAIGALVGTIRPAALPAAAPILAAWLLSPVIAFQVSQPRRSVEVALSDAERRTLRRIARKTWHFFTTFVGEGDHWLPPDNFQEIPDGRVAHRTSPTNTGLLLVSTLAAHDLGYIGLGVLLERLEHTFDSFDRLEKHWGHFYNWYDTRTLQPLPPRYLSTVDSGNFLGCLVTLKQGLFQKANDPVLGPAVIDGLTDTLMLAAEQGGEQLLRRLEPLFHARPADLSQWDEWLETVEREAIEATGRATSNDARPDGAGREATTWADRLVAEVRAWRAELSAVAPWIGTVRSVDTYIKTQPLTEQQRQSWAQIRAELLTPASLFAAAGQIEGLIGALASLKRSSATETGDAIGSLIAAIHNSKAAEWLDRLRALAKRAESLAVAMDFRPLYRTDRSLFAIGFNLAHGKLDNACYDLLASESCLMSYLAVARGEAPRRHWFHLGRNFIRAAGRIGLISWGGTMFEYMMPRLLLRSLRGTLLDEAGRTAVARQIEYGRQLGLPWGVSESAYAAQYPEGDYQYQAFGVPGLGLKQGLEKDHVIAPYATVMAAMVAPREALENLGRLAQEGAEGIYGLYEALDYTAERVPTGERRVVVRSYMAHHQGMSLVALANTLLADVMPRRFHAEPMVRAIDLLLQERIPADPPIVETTDGKGPAEVSATDGALPHSVAPMSRRLTSPDTPVPRTNLLSNSSYHVMITNAGSGYSKFHDLDVTRWRSDPTREVWGQFCYIRDVQRELVWSAGHQPICRAPQEYEVTFAADKATIRRRDADIETLLEVTVSPEQPVEVRRVTLTNHDSRTRELEITSYSEIVLAPHRDDVAHPAFGKLFLETEWVPRSAALLCWRRPRSDDEQPVYAMHVAAVDITAAGSTLVGTGQYETDRARFLGRGRGPANPAALDYGSTLSGTTGPVLDPIFSLRYRIRLKPGGSAVIALATAVAGSRAEALALADQYHAASAGSRVFELAWAHSQIEHRHDDRHGADGHLFQRLASHVIFAGSALRPDRSVLAANRLGQEGLWRFGISGDRPIILARFQNTDPLRLAEDLIAAQAYLRSRGLDTDLVFLSEEPGGYEEPLRQRLMELVRSEASPDRLNQPGGVFVLKAAMMQDDEKILVQAAARVVLAGDRGSLASQLDRTEWRHLLPGQLALSSDRVKWDDEPVRLPADLLFANGLGGFTPDGREYCVLISGQAQPYKSGNGQPTPAPVVYPRLTPAPWSNVIANRVFGFLVTESGLGFTWSGNSQTNRLTPWSNDPVSDPPGEVVYLRDEESGEVWCATPLPIPSPEPILVRHGQGYTSFERNAYGLNHELTLLVPPEEPLKLIRLRIRNLTDRRRKLSATYYAEWVLGPARDSTAMHVDTQVDSETGALLATNAFRTDFGNRVAFADVDRRPRTVTADRAEFVGRHGSLMAPAALARVGLSGSAGEALDPCAAIQTTFDLEPAAEIQVVFLLGEADSPEAARDLIRRFRADGQALRSLDEVRSQWEALLGTVQVRTPEPALDLLVNRWLLYQVLSCRVWGRSAFYQSGGAYGFRDQLQDVMALLHTAPLEARAHIVRAAGRQFPEGDVQHWWHPPAGRGVRTRIADDPLWLPFATARYVQVTGDSTILDETIPYLLGPCLKPNQNDDYGLPAASPDSGSLYDHCARALDWAQRLGTHGLPLMDHGDWNDGMNRVGCKGKGESVWLAWFQIACIRRFSQLSESRGDAEKTARWRQYADQLHAAVEQTAWDGSWYRRAFFDDGTPLGSAKNDACMIDSIAQTWGVLSGAGDAARVREAMKSVDERLVRPEERLILLFTPPFDHSVLEPGYIKGYLPGVRENGGQYTHAAAWVMQAVALLGNGQGAARLLRILNPILHAQDPEAAERYGVEPYVVAGDVYSGFPHMGRGGWTWYTGSASWYYQAVLESILGVHRLGDRVAFEPCISPEWSQFEITYRYRSATYAIMVENPSAAEAGVAAVWLDDERQQGNSILLADDNVTHHVRVVVGQAHSPATS